MYATLIKKVNISKGEKLKIISSNRNTNFMSLGGTNGFVQVVNFELEKPKNAGENAKIAVPLEYHQKTVTILAWNEVYNKLTTFFPL